MSDRERLTEIYVEKARAGLVDVRFNIDRGGTSEAVISEVLAMEEAICRGEFRPRRFGDSKAARALQDGGDDE